MTGPFDLAGRRRLHKAGEGFLPCDSGTGDESRILPPDLLEDAKRRLGVAALLYATVYFLAYFVNGITGWMSTDLAGFLFHEPQSWIAWGAIGYALAVFVLTRTSWLPPRKMMDGGLGLMIVGSAGIAVNTFWGILPDGPPDSSTGENHFMGVPWEAIWIIMCPAIAPNKPIKVLIAGLIAANMGLVVTLASRASGVTSPDVSAGFLLRYFVFTNYICAGIAWFGSLYINSLGRHVRRAREMGSYDLVKKLGAGGMGEVWQAEHRMLARPAAIKLIKQEMLGDGPAGCEEIRARFEREARATAKLHSAHTIRLFDFGTTSDGRFFYAMELLRGIGLDELVQKYGPQPPGRVVPLLLQACHALHDAHQTDLIHRDIKPGNIFVCHYGQEYDFVKILDFGLVKSTDPDHPGDHGLTQATVTPGTPGFLSPEIALAHPDIDGRADLYSLGCVAYYLLTGSHVFQGATHLETAAMHLKDAPISPSQRSEFDISSGLEEVIMTCLAKDPADRPPDARALAGRLADCPVDDLWDQERARRWWDVHDPCRGPLFADV